MKSIKVDEKVYAELKKLSEEHNTTLSDTIRKLLMLKGKSSDITELTDCIFEYYTYKNGQKVYDCPILNRGLADSITHLLTFCRLCNRKQIVMKKMELKLKYEFEKYRTMRKTNTPKTVRLPKADFRRYVSKNVRVTYIGSKVNLECQICQYSITDSNYNVWKDMENHFMLEHPIEL